MRISALSIAFFSVVAFAHAENGQIEYVKYESILSNVDEIYIYLDKESLRGQEIVFSDVTFDSEINDGANGDEPTILWSDGGKLRFYLPAHFDRTHRHWEYRGCGFTVNGADSIENDAKYWIQSICDDGVSSIFHFSERTGLIAFGVGEGCSDEKSFCRIVLHDAHYLANAARGFGSRLE